MYHFSLEDMQGVRRCVCVCVCVVGKGGVILMQHQFKITQLHIIGYTIVYVKPSQSNNTHMYYFVL